MAKWFLILIAVTSDNTPTMSQAGPFDSYDACARAAEEANKPMKETARIGSYSFTCVPSKIKA